MKQMTKKVTHSVTVPLMEGIRVKIISGDHLVSRTPL